MNVINSKLIVKNSLLLYLRMIVLMCIRLYTSRVVLQVLGIEDFGIYNVVAGFVLLFSFLNNAMSSATQRFLSFELGKLNTSGVRDVFSTSCFIHLLIAVLFFLVAETIGIYFLKEYMNIPYDRVDASYFVYHCSVISTVILMLTVPFNAIIIAKEKMHAFAYISIVEVSLKLLVVYVLLSINFDKLKVYALMMLAIQCFISLVYQVYCLKSFSEVSYKLIYIPGIFKKMIGFAVWNLIGNISAVAFGQGINLLLNVFYGPVLNAARGIAVQVQSAVVGFCYNFQTALNPQITKTYASGEIASMHNLIYRSSRFSFYLLWIIILPLLLETPFILNVWLGNVPEYAVPFTRLILAISVIDSLANPLMVSIMATGDIKLYQLVVGGVLLLIVPVSYFVLLFINLPQIVFIVHFIIACFAVLIRLFFARKKLNLSISYYFVDVVFKILIVAIFSCILPFYLHYKINYGIIRFLIVLVISLFSVSFTVYFVGLDRKERSFVLEKFLYLKSKIL